ncbi:MAG: hypothetical protein CFH18_00075 [Alphaproteobacteria bacterium MarineAlpha5_Bin8]|nr:MAG: hypothetical protein CFH18_00075 [Alphaproteobacteria bacterium MarineAlpha5_Bin8]PPR53884.1 MAG: hypothetical protein CFH16_00759 [Alphaproteobacteria bacterium MarineAlpha5_Bin6]|tara:strand:- start:2038 stop:3054 length:1017 start_codon:yes stop_codon:yes gene_type:complete
MQKINNVNSDFTIKTIKQMNIELFGGCNLGCPMCPQTDNGREKEFKRSMNFDLFKKIIDEAIPRGLQYVNIGGSGEPTMSKYLVDAVDYLTKHNIESLIYTNGQKLDNVIFNDLCKAGLTNLKISCQGWDKESYAYWMSIDTFDEMRNKIKDFKTIVDKNNYSTLLQTNHLIQDYNEADYQKSMYLKNWVNHIGCYAEIWKAHNWSGIYSKDSINRKDHNINKRSCGRPLSEVIEIRAGGLNGRQAAVVPCPNVLGRDSDAVLGHVDEEDVFDIFNGDKYRDLREKHIKKDFESIDYCKDCDHLISYPDALVWTNIPGRKYGESRISNIAYNAEIDKV